MKINDELGEAIDWVELRTGLQILQRIRDLPEPKKPKILVSFKQVKQW